MTKPRPVPAATTAPDEPPRDAGPAPAGDAVPDRDAEAQRRRAALDEVTRLGQALGL